MAGFIEDAEDLHLATKPMYAAVIHSFLERAEVRDAYEANTVNGAARLAALARKLEKVLGLPAPEQSAKWDLGPSASLPNTAFLVPGQSRRKRPCLLRSLAASIITPRSKTQLR